MTCLRSSKCNKSALDELNKMFLYLQAMQAAGVEGEQVYFILEDYQLINPEYLDLVNSLLSSGEVRLSGFLLVF